MYSVSFNINLIEYDKFVCAFLSLFNGHRQTFPCMFPFSSRQEWRVLGVLCFIRQLLKFCSPEGFGFNYIIFKCSVMNTSWESPVPLQNRTGDKSTLVQVMDWCHMQQSFTSTNQQRYAKLHVRMCRECRERFPRHYRQAIPTCITARAWRTCRDACRDR